MTRQDDALLNTQNPLYLRHPGSGGFKRTGYALNPDANVLNLLRWAGVWTSSRTKYIENEAVYHLGGVYACTAVETTEDPIGSNDWFPLSGVMGRGSAFTATQQATTIGAGWTTAPLDTEPTTPLGCLFDLPSNTFEFEWPGAWNLGVYLNFSHNESNGGRSFFVRLFNVTDNVAISSGTQVYVGRNQFGSSFAINFLAYADENDVSLNKQYRVEFGGSIDSFSLEFVEDSYIDLSQVSAQ